LVRKKFVPAQQPGFGQLISVSLKLIIPIGIGMTSVVIVIIIIINSDIRTALKKDRKPENDGANNFLHFLMPIGRGHMGTPQPDVRHEAYSHI
jgi:hypothetical protein